MIDLSASLVSIEASLRCLNREALLRSLQVGLSAETVRSFLESVGFSSMIEVEALYKWKNGTSTAGMTLDDITLFPGFYLLSIEDAIANYRTFVTDPRWRTEWLPLFANGGGDFYVLDLRSSLAGQVRHFRIDESDHPVEFASLAAMLTTLAVAFERGIFFVDANGYLEMNDLDFGTLAAELNNDVDWWRG